MEENSYSKSLRDFCELNFRKTKMEAKNILVSFLTIATVLLFVATVSAAGELASITDVQIEDISVYPTVSTDLGLTAGEVVKVDVTFRALQNDERVTVKVEFGDNTEETSSFNVVANKTYRKVLTIEVPSDKDLKDALAVEDLEFEVTIEGDDYKTKYETELSLQREDFVAKVMSISTVQNIEAGSLLPVEVVLKNVGYSDLDDLYVTVSIPALGAQRTGYFGDIVALECDDDGDAEYGVDGLDRKCDEDDSDTVYGTVYLQVPETAKSGVYALEVRVSNEDLIETAVKDVQVDNSFSGNNVIASVTEKSVAVGQDAVYSVLIVNPTSKLKVYRVVPETSTDLTVSVDENVIAVPAGSSKTVTVTASAVSEGTYNFNVDVFAGEELVNKVALSANLEGKSITGNPIVVLTVVLAIVFLVLLVVLFVLLGKKPEKAEEFGESYY